MIYFPPIKTRRLNLELKELTISQSVYLASMPTGNEEQEITKFLNFVIVDQGGGISDPLKMTVQERNLLVAQYLSATNEEGSDFDIGDNAKYSDYLDGEVDIEHADSPIFMAEIEGDKWCVQHLTGKMAETIERLKGEIKGADNEPISPYFHWLLGTMAAQLTIEGEVIPEVAGEYEEFIFKRMKVFANYPESVFSQLLFVLKEGQERLHHFFTIEIDRINGGYAIANKGGAAESRDLPLVKFPMRSCLGPFAKGMGKSSS